MEKVWSKYSLALYDTFANSEDNIIVQACPGAGKTTNIEHMWGMDNKPTLYTVFNKHNEVEAQTKLPEKGGSDIRTLNGLGHSIVLDTFGRVKLDKFKVMNIIKEMRQYRTAKGNSSREQQYILSKMVAVAKCVDTGTGFSEEMYDDALRTFSDIEEYSGLYEETVEVLRRSDNMTNIIDFQDQLRFPVIYDCIMPQYANVLGDEVQDWNSVQAAMLFKLNAGRYTLVGDSHQSIYGFRGAMNNSMSVLKEQFSCTELPLSITYRCAKDVVREAYNVYPDIQAWDNSPQGIVRYSEREKENFTASDIVLCRMNRPLVAMAYDLLKGGIACYVKGRDIGEGLIRLIKKQGCFTVRELIGRLNEEYGVECEKARVKEDEDKLQRLADKYSSALLFCNKASLEDTPDKVIDAINTVFTEGKGVCLSTVHKAKGLEGERAFILDTHLHDSFEKRARLQWQKEQERNIKYVAITRAKGELVYM